MGYVKIPEATNRTLDFTSSGTWTVPSGVYSAEFLVVGAGGGGGGTTNSVATRGSAGGGGGGGSVKLVTLPVSPGSSYTITIGAKGTGGTAGVAGVNGGFTEVLLSGTTLIRSYGGLGGYATNSADASVAPTIVSQWAGNGGNRGSGTTASIQAGGGGGGVLSFDRASYGTGAPLEGSLGGNASANGSNGAIGAFGYGNGGGGGGGSTATLAANQGGAAYGGGAGATASNVATATNLAGSNATLAGCGGGGAYSGLSTTGAAGGNGADGLVRITYFA